MVNIGGGVGEGAVFTLKKAADLIEEQPQVLIQSDGGSNNIIFFKQRS
jgi:hypothetical protein